MAAPYRPSSSRMDWTTGKNAGWTAFDRQQRKGNSMEPEINIEPYPPITSSPGDSVSTPNRKLESTSNKGPSKDVDMMQFLCVNECLGRKSFATVVQSSDFTAPSCYTYQDITCCGTSSFNESSKRNVSSENKEGTERIIGVEKLKMMHSWAEDALIEDVLAAVDYDDVQASELLQEMARATFQDVANDRTDNVCHDRIKLQEENQQSGGLTIGQFNAFPEEPEWEDDDIYCSHRKEATKMMRFASQHSRAASNAYCRGDHLKAHWLSSRAKEEWASANELNQKAAEDIFRVRNNGNDIWKLDLHGLHASEAVVALENHLKKIESQMLLKASTCFPETVSLNIVACPGIPRERRHSVLQVITGIGSHSRGNATLPAAVRSFLSANDYHFDDARPGVIAVKPKFRNP